MVTRFSSCGRMQRESGAARASRPIPSRSKPLGSGIGVTMAPAFPPLVVMLGKASAKSTGGVPLESEIRLLTDENPPVRLNVNDRLVWSVVPITQPLNPPKSKMEHPANGSTRAYPDGRPVDVSPDVLPEMLKPRTPITKPSVDAEGDSDTFTLMSPLASRVNVNEPQGGLPGGASEGADDPIVKEAVIESAKTVTGLRATSSPRSNNPFRLFRIAPPKGPESHIELEQFASRSLRAANTVLGRGSLKS